jgi:hypothetical protein
MEEGSTGTFGSQLTAAVSNITDAQGKGCAWETDDIVYLKARSLISGQVHASVDMQLGDIKKPRPEAIQYSQWLVTPKL